jgi:GDP-4-dehydro-6-deoxy-D-mannose reductase
VGNLDTWRDFTDVRDMMRAYELALAAGEPGATYNLGTGVPVSIRDLLDGLLALSRKPISVRVDPQRFRPADARILVGNPARFVRRTGWKPQIPLEQTLADILDDWRHRIHR